MVESMNTSLPFAAALSRTVADVLEADPSVVVFTEGDAPGNAELRARFADRVIAMPVVGSRHVGGGHGHGLGPSACHRRCVVHRTVALRLRKPSWQRPARRKASPRPSWLRVPFGHEAGRVDGAALDMLAGIEGVTVVCPRHAGRAVALMRAALQASGPVVFLEPRARQDDAAPVSDAVAKLYGCDVVHPGDDVTVLTWGEHVAEAVGAAEALAAQQVHVQVVDPEVLAPLDVQAVGALLRDTGRLIVASPDSDAAYARRVLQASVRAAFLFLEAPPVVCGASADAVTKAVRDAMAY